MGTHDWEHRLGRAIGGVFLLDLDLENLQLLLGNREHPLEIRAHLPLHLVDLLQRKHALTNYTPRLFRIRIVADNLRGDHERRDE